MAAFTLDLSFLQLSKAFFVLDIQYFGYYVARKFHL